MSGRVSGTLGWTKGSCHRDHRKHRGGEDGSYPVDGKMKSGREQGCSRYYGKGRCG